jgi:hypothetical protein
MGFEGSVEVLHFRLLHFLLEQESKWRKVYPLTNRFPDLYGWMIDYTGILATRKRICGRKLQYYEV